MEIQPKRPAQARVVEYRTLHTLCGQLRRKMALVVPPVHLFDLPPQVMRGLFSVAWVAQDGTLHRCELPYLDAAAIDGERRQLAGLLRWGEVDRTVGRIEIGENTGELLRYFLPDSVEQGRRSPQRPERCQSDWLSAACRTAGTKRVWLARGAAGEKIGGISVGGAHLVVRLPAECAVMLRSACRRLACKGVEVAGRASPLFRDVMGEWRGR